MCILVLKKHVLLHLWSTKKISNPFHIWLYLVLLTTLWLLRGEVSWWESWGTEKLMTFQVITLDRAWTRSQACTFRYTGAWPSRLILPTSNTTSRRICATNRLAQGTATEAKFSSNWACHFWMNLIRLEVCTSPKAAKPQCKLSHMEWVNSKRWAGLIRFPLVRH